MKEREMIEKEGESLGDVVEDEMASTSVVSIVIKIVLPIYSEAYSCLIRSP